MVWGTATRLKSMYVLSADVYFPKYFQSAFD